MRRGLGHRSARRRLPALLDGGLSAAEARAVRRHAARCRRCARHWRELEASERLLRRLPASVVDPGDRAGDRLAALSRWGPRPRPRPATGGAGLPALGAVAAAAALVVLLSLVGVSPKGVPSERPVLVSAVVPESNLIPDGWR